MFFGNFQTLQSKHSGAATWPPNAVDLADAASLGGDHTVPKQPAAAVRGHVQTSPQTRATVWQCRGLLSSSVMAAVLDHSRLAQTRERLQKYTP